jgi:hypothetical protein
VFSRSLRPTQSDVIVPPPTSTGEGMGASLPESACCGVAKLPYTNNERENKAREPTLKLSHKQKKTKNSFSIVNFSKVDPLYKCRSVSFYREKNGLFTYRDCPHVKRIKTECARLISGGLQLGLHIIGAL